MSSRWLALAALCSVGCGISKTLEVEECAECPTTHAVDIQQFCGPAMHEIKDPVWEPLHGPGPGEELDPIRSVDLRGHGCFQLRFMDLERGVCAYRGAVVKSEVEFAPRKLALQAERWFRVPSASCAAAVEVWRERARAP